MARSTRPPSRPATAAFTSRPAAALALLFCPLAGWLAGALAAGCRSTDERPQPAMADALTDGPMRWLLLPEERRQARRLHNSAEAVEFIENFWRRRNPDPRSPQNDFARVFYERVESADRLYGEDGSRGSLTDRGRALIVLGPPPELRYGQRRLPSWEPGQPSSRPAIHTRNVGVETWKYEWSDLPPKLVALLAAEAPGQEVVLVFLVDTHHTRLIEGGHLLDLAARAAVHDPIR